MSAGSQKYMRIPDTGSDIMEWAIACRALGMVIVSNWRSKPPCDWIVSKEDVAPYAYGTDHTKHPVYQVKAAYIVVDDIEQYYQHRDRIMVYGPCDDYVYSCRRNAWLVRRADGSLQDERLMPLLAPLPTAYVTCSFHPLHTKGNGDLTKILSVLTRGT